jgi:two-component system, OmpR family, response regulator
MKDPSLRRILFVEDDPDIRMVGKMALEAIGGFSVLACGSGVEALTRLSDFAPDLILLDVMMPGMDGPATLGAVRETPAGRDLPVVFMTARVQAQEVAAYRDMGAEDVIAKPFDPMALSEQVLSVWRTMKARTDAAQRSDG